MIGLIVKNFLFQVVSRVISTGYNLFLSILVVRATGFSIYGDFSIVMNYIAIFVAISEFGSNSAFIMKFKDKEYFRNNFSKFLGYRLIVSLISLLLCILIVVFSNYNADIKSLILIASVLLLTDFISKSFGLAFQAFNDYSQWWMANMLAYSLAIAYLVYLSLTNQVTVFNLVTINIFINVTIGAFLLFYYKNQFNHLIVIRFSAIRRYFGDAWPLGVVLLMNFLMVSLDRVLLSFYAPDTEVGGYSLAYRLFEFMLIMPTFIMNTTYPILLEYLSTDFEKFKRNFVQAIISLALIGLGITGLVFIFSFLIVEIWGGQAIISKTSLNLLSIGLVLFFITSPLSWFMVATKMYKKMITIYLSGLIFNLFLNMLFLPKFGYVAASVITVFTEFIVFVGLLICTKDTFLRKSYTYKKTDKIGDLQT